MASNTSLDRLKKKLARVPVEARKEMRKALEQGAYEIADTAHAWAPSNTGALKRSIGYTFGDYKADNANVRGMATSGGGKDPDLSVTVHAGDATAFYAAFVEFGTVHAKAQPYFFPAYRANKKRVKNRINRAIKKAAKAAVQG